MGKASRKWAFAEAAVRFLRDHPAGQKYLTRVETTHGRGKALTLLAQKLGRAVYDRVNRHQAFDVHKLLQDSCAERVSLTPNWTCTGCA
jgi:hypothetical protein